MIRTSVGNSLVMTPSVLAAEHRSLQLGNMGTQAWKGPPTLWQSYPQIKTGSSVLAIHGSKHAPGLESVVRSSLMDYVAMFITELWFSAHCRLIIIHLCEKLKYIFLILVTDVHLSV